MIFDLIVIVALFFSCVIAFLRGFIREVLTVIGIIGGAAAAVVAGPALSPVFRQLLGVQNGVEPHKYFGLLPADHLADILAYGAIFLAVVIALSIVSHFLSGWAKAIGLGPLNRVCGVLFGIVRAVLLLSLFYLPVYLWTEKSERDQWSWMQGSHARVYIESISAWMAGLMPESMTKGLDKDNLVNVPSLNATRQKLQDLDVLRHPGEPAPNIPARLNIAPPVPAVTPAPAPTAPVPQPGQAPYAAPDDNATPVTPGAAPPMPPMPDQGAGYQNGQRQDMKNLIDKGLNDSDDR